MGDKIGLFSVDSVIPNLALMKLSAYYKKWKYNTEKYSPLLHSEYWLIYASKVFKYPHPNDAYVRENMIKGGPGFNIYTKLCEEVDHYYPDYGLYNCDYAMGYLTKGCIRTCEWCIVPEMEGNIHKFAELKEFTENQTKIKLLDNNILAYKNHIEEIEKLRDSKKQIDFNQGLDIRLITKENASILREIRRWKGLRYRFAFDNPHDKKLIKYKLEILYDAGFTNGILQFYVLIGFNTLPREDLMRVNFLKRRGIDAFVMPFNKMDPYQKKFARWVNRHYYKKCSFKEYLSTQTNTPELYDKFLNLEA